VVPLPNLEDFTNLVVQAINCSEYNEASRVASCDSIQTLLKSFRVLHATARNRIRSTIGYMYELLPESYVDRQPRGFFDLGGQLFHSVFRVNTDQQIEAFRPMAIYSANNNAKAFESWQKHAEKLSSFIAVSNRRFDNLAQSMVTHLHGEVLKFTTDLTTLQTLMACAIVNITNFISVLNEADDICLAIEGLVHGQLSPIILPPDAIKQTLTKIHSALPYSLTGLYLEQIPAEYYRMHNFVAARQGNNLLFPF